MESLSTVNPVVVTTKARGRLFAALGRHGAARLRVADPEGLTVSVAVPAAGEPDGFLQVRGRVSTAVADVVAAALDSVAWRAGTVSLTPAGLAVPVLGSVVRDVTQIERPGRVVDWDGRDQLILRPPTGGVGEWVALVADVHPVDGEAVDTGMLDR
jgi:hypothetical protein